MNLGKSFARFFLERQTCFNPLCWGLLIVFGAEGIRTAVGGNPISALTPFGIGLVLFLNCFFLQTRVQDKVVRVRLGALVPLAGFDIPLQQIKTARLSETGFKLFSLAGINRKKYNGVSVLAAQGSGMSGVFIETATQTHFIGSARPQSLLEAIEQAKGSILSNPVLSESVS